MITLPELCVLDGIDDVSCSSNDATPREYNSLDECLDAYTPADHIRSHNNRNKHQRVSYSDQDMRPLAFVRLNTRLGKPKPVTIRALLDSGASESLVTSQYVEKLRVQDTQQATTVWNTPAGEQKTTSKVKVQFTIPNFSRRN